MLARLFALRHRPVFLLGMAAVLTALLVQSGELGSSDTQHRLQATHSFWTSEPAVLPGEYPEFGLIGRHGRIYGWYGMGQSLLMLPADIVGTWLEKLPLFADYRGNDPGVRDIVVSVSTNILVCVLAVLVCFRFLRRLDFSPRQAIAGALGLLFATTFLHYTQNMVENNFIMLLTLVGFCFQYEWLRTGRTRALLYGSLALGANLLTRLTTALNLAAVGVFLLLVLLMERRGWRELRARLAAYLKIAVPCYAFFFAIDRAYQYYRFGSVFNTYLSIFGEQQKQLDPSLPANFPWSTPWRVGLLGPLITREKSIFLFDPLIVLALLLAVLLWKRLRPEMRSWLIVTTLLVAAHIIFYARYVVWSGDFAWGDRYVSTAVELAGDDGHPAALAAPARAAAAVVERRLGAHLGERSLPTFGAGLLVSAGDLSDEHARAALRDRPALREHRGGGAGQSAGVGTEQLVDVGRSLAATALHHALVSAVLAGEES